VTSALARIAGQNNPTNNNHNTTRDGKRRLTEQKNPTNYCAGTQEYVSRLQKLVDKFVATLPGELEAAQAAAAAAAGPEATAAADACKEEGNDNFKAAAPSERA
jgi:hypothetical protein